MADGHRRQGPAAAGARRRAGLQPQGRGHVVRRGGRPREVRRAARAGRGRARADRRRDRQHQGRHRHRREGRAGPDHRLRERWTRCSRGPSEVPQKKYREALLSQADDARQSRELARLRTRRAVRVRRRAVPTTADRTAPPASPCSRNSGSARSCPSTRRRQRRSSADYRIVDDIEGVAALVARPRGRRPLRLARDHDAPTRPCAPASSAWRSPTAPRHGALRSRGASRARQRPAGRPGSGARRRSGPCSRTRRSARSGTTSRPT